MEAKIVRVLATPVSVMHRSSDSIWPRKGEICLDEKGHSVQIFLLEEGALGSGEGMEIRTTEIEHVKAKDYSELGNSQWVLHVVERSGRSTSFEFEKKDTRDTWIGLSGLMKAPDDFTVPEMEIRYPVTDVKVVEPRERCLLSLDLVVNGATVEFDVPNWKISQDDWKEATIKFVREKQVNHSDRHSLYRLVKACAARVLAAREAKRIVNDIDNLFIDRLIEAAPDDRLKSPAFQCAMSMEKLTQLEHQLERSSIWQSGIGPITAAKLCIRNIEKTRLINETIAQTRSRPAEQAPLKARMTVEKDTQRDVAKEIAKDAHV